MTQHTGPHQGQPVLAAGASLDRAQAAMIMVHGRGASAESILTLASELDQAGFAYLAPQAAGNTWYPQRFTAPLAQNEPYLSSALGVLGDLFAHVQAAGIPTEAHDLAGLLAGRLSGARVCGARRPALWRPSRPERRAIGPDGTPRDYLRHAGMAPRCSWAVAMWTPTSR